MEAVQNGSAILLKLGADSTPDIETRPFNETAASELVGLGQFRRSGQSRLKLRRAQALVNIVVQLNPMEGLGEKQ